MLRTLAIFVLVGGISVFVNVTASADCAASCNNGFDVCMRNCGGQSGCLATCSRGRAGCLKRCGSSDNSPLLRSLRLADRCAGVDYYSRGATFG